MSAGSATGRHDVNRSPNHGVVMPNDDEKLIIRAAKRGDLATVRAMIKKNKALLRARDTDGSTPLHCASWKGHVACKVLRERLGRWEVSRCSPRMTAWARRSF